MIKVRRLDGAEEWVLLHVVPQRVYQYHHRTGLDFGFWILDFGLGGPKSAIKNLKWRGWSWPIPDRDGVRGHTRDIRVTEGTHALEVDYTAATWNADFQIPFARTKLADILKLDLPADQRPSAADLERYTLRFDVAFPDQDADSLPSWEVLSYNTLGAQFPSSQPRRDGTTGQMQTYSMTLDQLTWSDTAAGAPVIMFVADADWADTGSTLYYDNFRIIDTGATSTATEIRISSVQYNAKTGSITIQWNSDAGKTYAVDYTQKLGSWPTVLSPNVRARQAPPFTPAPFRLALTASSAFVPINAGGAWQKH